MEKDALNPNNRKTEEKGRGRDRRRGTESERSL